MSGLLLASLSVFTSGHERDLFIYNDSLQLSIRKAFLMIAASLLLLSVMNIYGYRYLFSHFLNRFYVFLTISIAVYLAGFLWWSDYLYSPTRYIDYSSWNGYNEFHKISESALFLILLYLLTQVIFITNLAIGILKKG
jgi:hypothetical protein